MSSVLAESPAETHHEFAQPKPGRVFEFPRDHGSHAEFRTEWWYVTGHLAAKDGRRLGFQVTFFRQASAAGQTLYLAHSALLDAKTGRFINEEKLNREGWDADASASTLNVRNGNWSLVLQDKTLDLASTVRSEAQLLLHMTPTKGLVVFGKDGVSRKGASDAAASHYLTFPRLRCEGSVKLGAEEVAVTGEAWMDHEFSSSQLDAGQVGWDWTGVQLNDGSEIMCYRMRRNDGSSDPAGTTLVHVLPDGTLKTLAANEFQWQPTHSWTSPKTQTHYPIGARLTFSGRTLELKPLCDGQELDGLLSGLP